MFMRKFLEKLATDEKVLVLFVTVCCTICTFYMVLFMNDSVEFDALMIMLNGFMVVACVEVLDENE